MHLVRVMDGFNRFRFAEQGEVLAEWESASNVFGPVHTNSEKPTSQEVTPPAGRREDGSVTGGKAVRR